MVAFQLDTAELVGTLVETLLYGAALVLGWRTIIFFHKSRKRTQVSISPIFVLAPWLMLVFATMHIAIDWHRIFVAFLNSETRVERTSFLGNLHNWTYLFKDGIYVAQTFIGDSIVVFRCYMIWQKNIWVVLLPLSLSIGTLGKFGGFGAVGSAVVSSGIFLGEVQKFITAFWIMTVSTNVIATGLILLRLWLSERSRKSMFSNVSLAPIIAIVLESGSIYCLTCIVGFVLFETGNNAQVIVLNALSSLIIVLFSFVLLRISGTAGSLSLPAPSQTGRSDYNRGPPLEVNVSRYIEMSPMDDKIIHPPGQTSTPSTGGESFTWKAI